MSGEAIFVKHHRVTLLWRSPTGVPFTQQALLQGVTSSTLRLHVAFEGIYGPLPIGTDVTIGAPDVEGSWLAQFRGQVMSIRSRLLEIHLHGEMDLVQRRQHPRVRHPFSFNTAVLLNPSEARYFLAHPVNISVGGIRFLHRLPLRAGDRVRISLRPRDGVIVSPTAHVVECLTENAWDGTLAGPARLAARARFDDSSGTFQRFLTRYVSEMQMPDRESDQAGAVEVLPQT